jgi:hypothetical protein
LPDIFEILTTIGFLSTIGLLALVALAVVGLWYAIEEWQFRRRVGRACDKALDEDLCTDSHKSDAEPSRGNLGRRRPA